LDRTFGGEMSVYLRPLERDSKLRSVLVDERGNQNQILMFGSNDYLGLSIDVHVRQAAIEAMNRFGLSMCGSPVLNGYSRLHRALELSLARLKGYEDVMLFPSGFAANLGWIQSLVRPGDVVVYDEYSHTSFRDGLSARSGVVSAHFRHNDLASLVDVLTGIEASARRDVFLFVEGLYSMDGDTAPLPELRSIVEERGFILVVDDAHGTGVLGERGAGIEEYCGLQRSADVLVGSLSKGLGAVGGFVCGSHALIKYMRGTVNAYVFSASLPPPIVGGALAAVELLRSGDRVKQLKHVVRYARTKLKEFSPSGSVVSPILPIRSPRGVGACQLTRNLQSSGIFVSAILFPAVPVEKERIRISITADHTESDIDQLYDALSVEFDRAGQQGY
jgi:glycine C-acetyltransferase